MEKTAVGFLGCGNIGCGVYRLIMEHGAAMEENEGVAFDVRRVLVRSLGKKRSVEVPREIMTDCADDVLADPEIKIVMEFMGGVEPAASYMIRALQNGKTVVTANKMALASRWDDIVDAARSSGAGLYYEASVCGAIPIIRAMNDSLQANRITSVMGIINGTTNYILSRMSSEGAAYEDVLSDAQRLGLAEPDPTADVEGYDAAYKLSILSSLAFHKHIPVESVYREGITNVTPLDVQCGKEFGLTLKLLAVAKEENGKVQTRVHPTFIPNAHPLASVTDAFNAVYVQGHACGEMMFYANEELMKQVFINLLDNAVKFSPDDSSVKVIIQEKVHSLVFLIRDQGKGIDKETASHIFEKFYQGDTSHAVRGNGLGMTIAKRIVTLHGGTIRVSSSIGKGTTIEVELPIVSLETSKAVTNSTP